MNMEGLVGCFDERDNLVVIGTFAAWNCFYLLQYHLLDFDILNTEKDDSNKESDQLEGLSIRNGYG